MADETLIVRGEVVLPLDVPATGSADLIVQVEDVSRADAPSVVIAEERRPGIAVTAGAAHAFEVEVPAQSVDPRSSYSVRAHVDVSGTGSVDPGDLISTQSHPVLTRGHGDRVTIPVRRV